MAERQALYQHVYENSFKGRKGVPAHRYHNTAKIVIYRAEKLVLRPVPEDIFAFEEKLPDMMAEYAFCLKKAGVTRYQHEPKGLADMKEECSDEEDNLFYALLVNYLQNIELTREEQVNSAFDAIDSIDSILSGL